MRKEFLKELWDGKVLYPVFTIDEENNERYGVRMQDGKTVEFTFDDRLTYGLRFYAPHPEYNDYESWEEWDDSFCASHERPSNHKLQLAISNWVLLAKGGELGKNTAFKRGIHDPRWRAKRKINRGYLEDFRIDDIKEIFEDNIIKSINRRLSTPTDFDQLRISEHLEMETELPELPKHMRNKFNKNGNRNLV